MTAQRVLAVARAQIGTVEAPPGSNRTKYGAAYGMDGVAWCAIWVWWCFREAGLSPLIPKTAYTPTFANWFKARGQWSPAPRPGAVVFFDFPGDGVNRISHVGIVEAVNRDGSVTTIEGNTTAPGGAGSQRDGGGVWRRTRKTGVVGYGHPRYETATTEDDDMFTDADRALLNSLARRVDVGYARDQILTALDVADPLSAPGVLPPGQTAPLPARVDALRAAVDQLLTRVVSGTPTAGPAVLSDADVQRVAAAVVALLGRKTSAP